MNRYVLNMISRAQIFADDVTAQHDLDIWRWAQTCQAAVTAIRKAGAKKNKILLPGTDSTSAGSFLYDGSAEALLTVKNLDHSTTGLIFEVHKYLDFDESGTHNTCSRNNVEVFQNLGNWLRDHKRKAILAETGGSAYGFDCRDRLCEQLDTIDSYSDVYLGWLGWAAGMFEYNTTLSETPKKTSTGYEDVRLVKDCIAGKF
jgi:endoglucanase